MYSHHILDATPATPREPVVPPVSNDAEKPPVSDDSEENPAPDCIRSDSNAPFISIAGTLCKSESRRIMLNFLHELSFVP